MRLKDKVTLITGATGGIGRATARAFAAEGAEVWVLDVDEDACRALVDEIGTAGGRAHHRTVDVRSSESIGAAIDDAGRSRGRLDVVMAGAGVLRGAFQSLAELDESTWDQVIDTNLKGAWLTARHAAPWLVAGAPSTLLLISSIAGVKIKSSSYAYAASKAGLHGMLQNFEHELVPQGVRCNVICPDAIATSMKMGNIQDAARAVGEDPDAALDAARPDLGDPEALARVLTFLASDDAAYVRGTIFTR